MPSNPNARESNGKTGKDYNIFISMESFPLKLTNGPQMTHSDFGNFWILC